MYDLMDRHNYDMVVDGMYIYSPREEIKKLQKINDELREDNQKLIEQLEQNNEAFDMLTKYNYIDGHFCYKEVSDVVVESFDYEIDNPSINVVMSGDILYKDINTHEIIAVRHVKCDAGEK